MVNKQVAFLHSYIPQFVNSYIPSFIIHHPSSIIHHPSSIIHHPSSIIHHLSSIIYHLPSIFHHPLSIIHHPSSIIHHPSSIIHHPSSIIVAMITRPGTKHLTCTDWFLNLVIHPFPHCQNIHTPKLLVWGTQNFCTMFTTNIHHTCHVRCSVSGVKCYMSGVTCHL